MRITAGGPLDPLHGTVSRIEKLFADAVTRATRTAVRNVMLGDATVTPQASFEPARVAGLFESVVGSLDGWQSQGVTTTSNEDIRRVFVKFRTDAGGYVLSGHFSVQFHVLLYYVPDQRVVDCQRALSETIDASKSGEEDLARASEGLVAAELKSRGYGDLDAQDLFETLYDNDELRGALESKLEEGRTRDLRRLQEKKSDLFAELDGLLTEVYRCSAVMIDDGRLVTGEEGFLCTFDVELVRDGRRLSIPQNMDGDAVESLRGRLERVAESLERHGAG